jgi:hypothetical protein
MLAVARNHRVTACEAIGPQRAEQIAAGLSPRALELLQRRRPPAR